ncbi:MAG: LysM peptidoglycan-binding domain-containing protein [Gemmatimonadales bacterium]
MARTMISRSKSLALTLGLAAAAVPAAAVAQSPASVPAVTDSTHTVKTGDTLWGLAQQYMGDPLLWPAIYRLNTAVVEDPHWIYPGEVLRLRSDVAVASVPADTTAPVTVAVVAPPADTTPASVPPPADTAVAATATPAVPAVDTGSAAVESAAAAPDTTPPEPVEPQDTAPIFPPTSGLRQPDVIQTTFEDDYRPLRRSDFYSSGFLSERQTLPYGRVIGNAVPLQISSSGYGAASSIYSKIALAPPKGGSYQVGDTLLLVTIARTDPTWGDVVQPVGLAKVIDVSRPQNLAVVIAQYGSIHEGTRTLLAEKFVDPGHVRATPVANGIQGHVLFALDLQPLKLSETVVFIDKGRADGVRAGDIFEVQVTPNDDDSPIGAVPNVAAHLKIVHVGDHSATARITSLTAPKFESGSPIRQIAKLPG